MFNKINLWVIVLPAVTSAVLILTVLLFFRFLPDKLPLFYSLPWGERQLATPEQFLIIPSIIILVTLVNLAVAKQLHQQQIFLKKALLLSSLIVTSILTITFIKIVFLFI